MEKTFNYDLIGNFNDSDAKAVIKQARESGQVSPEAPNPPRFLADHPLPPRASVEVTRFRDAPMLEIRSSRETAAVDLGTGDDPAPPSVG